jgi:hypothetical protein
MRAFSHRLGFAAQAMHLGPAGEAGPDAVALRLRRGAVVIERRDAEDTH